MDIRGPADVSLHVCVLLKPAVLAVTALYAHALQLIANGIGLAEIAVETGHLAALSERGDLLEQTGISPVVVLVEVAPDVGAAEATSLPPQQI